LEVNHYWRGRRECLVNEERQMEVEEEVESLSDCLRRWCSPVCYSSCEVQRQLQERGKNVRKKRPSLLRGDLRVLQVTLGVETRRRGITEKRRRQEKLVACSFRLPVLVLVVVLEECEIEKEKESGEKRKKHNRNPRGYLLQEKAHRKRVEKSSKEVGKENNQKWNPNKVALLTYLE
jgi:hypothetical protein